jgi:hypothetical protein
MKDLTRAEYDRIRAARGQAAGPVFCRDDVEALATAVLTIRRGFALRTAERELQKLLGELRATAWLIKETNARLDASGDAALPATELFDENAARLAALKYDSERGEIIWHP